MHVADIAIALAQKNTTVEVMCAPASNLEKKLRRHAISCHPIPAGGYIRPIAIARAIKMLRKIQPDVIHVHYSKDLWWLIPAVLFAKPVPILMSKHIGTQKPKRDPLHRFLYSRLSFIIAISEVIRKNIVDTHPVSPEKVVVVHHGVDLSRYNPESIDRHLQRQRLGYSEKHLVLGIIGRLQPSKGYYEFLQMAATIRLEYPQSRFLIVGEASHGEQAQAQKILDYIHEHNLADVVQHSGYREDIPEVLAVMDIFVFPSHAEAFGLVLIEAMAMAKPVISSNCDGVPEIVVDGHSGLLTPPKDAERLIHVTRQMIDDSARRAQLASNARRRIVEKFNVEKMMQKIRELYMQAVNEC